MAKTVTKFNKTKTGFIKKTKNSITKRDYKDRHAKLKHDLEMAKVNNSSYQKEITKRMNALTAGASVATPTTTALANTNAFSSGGFNLNDSTKDDTEESDSVGNNSQMWG